MAASKKIQLNDILINTENYRFEPVASQKEAIDKMVEDQGQKLANLAEDIVVNGLNPNDRIQVVASSHDVTKYNVVEGNRRIVTLKLLNNPELIDGTKQASLKRKFKSLHATHRATLPKECECTVYDTPFEADKWIKLKHAGEGEGVGTVKWTSQQIQRFEEKVEGKSSIALQTIKMLEGSPDVPSTIKNNLVDLKITNLDRLLSDPDVRDFLGIEINNGILQSTIDEKEVMKGLVGIAKDLLDPKFKVNRIYTKEDRRDYISKAPKPDLSKKAAKPWQFNQAKSAVPLPKPAPKPKPNPKDRNVLIPKSCILKISNSKVNTIYGELQKIDIRKFTNAVGVLYRVFIELSVDCYIEDHKLATTPSSAKSGATFQPKVFQVANHLETQKLADATICKGVRSAVKDSNDILGIDTWHAYVHNNRFSPKADNLIITWDNMQDFMMAVWNNIK